MLNKIKSLRILSKSKKTLKQAVRLYRQKHKLLDPMAKERIETLLTTLQDAILQKNSELSGQTSKQIVEASIHYMPRSTWDKTRDFLGAIGFALLVAIAIRQMWFEFYSIPTGSMRPTLKEGDYLVVSKTDYGINTPLRSGHFIFDPDLVERGAIVVWTGENMDMPDDDTMYFYVIPGKKQYIKRMIGKPGDTLYFYGGEIYGVDAQGRELTELRDPIYFKTLEHIPFIRFEGKVEMPNPSTAIFYQMNEPIAKLTEISTGIFSGSTIAQKGHAAPTHYSDFWGFKNYGMSRLLTKDQVIKMHPGAIESLPPGLLYLEIHHHPSLQNAKRIHDEMNRLRPTLSTSVSLLALGEEHVNQILAHMTTARFEVKNGRVFRYGSGTGHKSVRPELPGVPNGMYEIQDGKASQILFGGIAKALSSDHPLLRQDNAHIQALYNFGIEWSNYYAPASYAPLPSRYVYYRDGDLYLMGGIIMKKGDPLLNSFLKNEQQKQAISTSIRPYFPFKDAGAPIKQDGKLNIEYIQQFGVTVPDKMYLVMGDNHAMSSDSRHFGFVPQDNLRGGASFLFWPAGDRWGRHPQASIKHLTTPNLIVLGIASVTGAISYLFIRRRYYHPFNFKSK